MPELILLCAGAAAEAPTASGEPGAVPPHDAFSLQAAQLAPALSGGALARAFLRGRCSEDRSDPNPLPRELPDEAWLRGFFGVAASDSIAAWAATALGAAPPCWRATPVHVEVGRHQIVLADPLALGLTAEDADALADAARPVLEAAGFSLITPRPGCWFLSGNADWSLDTHAWNMAVGRSVDGYLPRGDKARTWRRLFTELQMAWHEHPANEARAARGLPPVNALWLDGCARTPPATRAATVLTRDEALAGVAAAAGCTVHPTDVCADDAPELAASAAASGDLLVDAGFWRLPRRHGDPCAWHQAWLAFDHWLGARVRAGGLPPPGFDRVRLVASGERRLVELVLARGDRWRWLRRFDAPTAMLTPGR